MGENIQVNWRFLFCIRYSKPFIIKKYETLRDNPSIRIYINITENRITFKTKTGYYVEFYKVEQMKLLETKEKGN